MSVDGKVFLSHSSHDRQLAALLEEVLSAGGVPTGRIFYSSERATGIPAGKDVRPSLQQELRSAALVLELITESFLTRPYCLMELGAAWALDTPTFPIVVPPLTSASVADQIGDVHLNRLGTVDEIDDLLDELHDRIASDAAIQMPTTIWNRATRRFKDRITGVLSDVSHAGASSSGATPVVDPPADYGVHIDSARTSGVVTTNESVLETRIDTEVHGEITNTGGRQLNVFLKAVFYNSARRIIGYADGSVSDLGPEETKVFTLSSRDPIVDYASVRMQVEHTY